MKMRIATLVLAAVAMVGLGASQASAGLVLDTTANGGGTLLAITPGTTNITNIQLSATVTGTDSTNAINKIFYSVYSTNVGVPATNLARVNLLTQTATTGSWNTAPVWQQTFGPLSNENGMELLPLTYSGAPNGTAQATPSSTDLDGDGDLDRGSTGTLFNNPNGTNWGGIDISQASYTPMDSDGNVTGDAGLINYWSSSNTLKFITAVAQHGAYSAQPFGHGITQIYMVGKIGESNWRKNGAEVTGTPATGSKLTLYQTATAHNTTAELTVDSADGGANLLNGSTSVGSMNQFTWKVRPAAGGAFVDVVTNASSDTVALTYAMMHGVFGDNFGDYVAELVTQYTSADTGTFNSSTDATDGALIHYTPEPGTILFLAAGSAGLAFIRRRRSRK